jgi:hypothetical protein
MRHLVDGSGEERGGGDGAKSCDNEKAWSSINHSILSGGKVSQVLREEKILK